MINNILLYDTVFENLSLNSLFFLLKIKKRHNLSFDDDITKFLLHTDCYQ